MNTRTLRSVSAALAAAMVLLVGTLAHAAIVTVPSGLLPGDQYRLVFVTSTTTYSGGSNHGSNPPWFTSIADYNAFATTTATAVTTLNALNTQWYAVVSTGNPTASANANTLTRTSDLSAPIYNLGGLSVATGNADLWDGSIAHPINVTELGGLPPASAFDGKLRVWTGTQTDGTSPGATNALITQDGGYIRNGLASATDSGWIGPNYANEVHALAQPIYVISGILTVPQPPASVWTNPVDGNWADDTKWTGGVPDAAGKVAQLTGSLTANVTVTLTSAHTVGTLSLGNSSTGSDASWGYNLVPSGTGSLVLDNSGSASQVTVSAGNHVISAPVVLAGDVALTTAAAGTITVSGQISEKAPGGYALTKAGAGTLVLSASNSYSGATNLNGGVLNFSQYGLGSGTAVNFAGGTLQYALGNTSDISSRTVTLGTGGGTLDTGSNNVVFANPIGNGGAGGLTKAGAGMLTLSGSNTYSGATAISAGTLQLGNGAAAATLASTTVNNSGTLAFNHNDAATFSAAISGSGGLYQTGGGTLTLNGANTFTGPTTVNGSSLVGNTASLPGAINLANSATVTFSQTANGTYAKAVSGSGTLVKQGSGTLTLTSPENYTGPTTVNAGVLKLASIITQPAGLNPGDQYRLAFVTSGKIAGKIAAGGPADISGYNTFATNAASGVPALSALLTTWKAVVATYNPNNRADNNTGTSGGGGVPIYNLGGLRVVDNNADLWDGTIQNPINVTELGGAPALARDNFPRVWTGCTDTGGGYNTDWSLIHPSGGWISNGLANHTDGSWVYGNYNNDIQSDQLPIYVMSGILTATTGASVSILPAATSVAISAGAALDLGGLNQQVASLGDGSGGGSVINSNTGAASLLTVNLAGGSTTFSGVIAGGGTLGTIGLIKQGAGTMVLAGTNTYTGETQVLGGLLQLAPGATLGPGTSVTVDGGALDIGTNAQTIGGLYLAGGTLASSGTGKLTVGTDFIMESGQATASLGGTGKLTKNYAAGTVILSGSNDYSGGTQVNAGTLNIATADALPPGGNVTIASGGHVVLASGLSHAISLGGLTITGGVGQASPLVQSPGQAGSLTPTPEPGPVALLAAGALTVLAVWRRRNRRT